MIRNFNKTESTRKLLSDAKQMSWHSTRSISNFSMASSGQEGSMQSSRRSISRKSSVSKYDRVKLHVEECVRAETGSPFAYETVVRRKGNMITMDMQLSSKTVPLFVAEKHGQTYVFRSDPKNHDCTADTIMGTLCKKSMPENGAKSTTLTYALTHHDPANVPQKIVYFDYDYATKLQLLTDPKKHPRRCRAYVFGRCPIDTKEPYTKEGGERALDFHGRGREGSRKNMQLQDKDGKVVCQMVKWGKDQFHVDYSYPFDAFHAFGFALAQFDM